MHRKLGGIGSVARIMPVMLLALMTGCGGGDEITDELAVVPGLCFLHVHIEEGVDASALTALLPSGIPLWLCDSLLPRGPLGISLLGVNLTDLSPQLLFLTRAVEPSEIAGLFAAATGCEVRENGSRLDVVTSGGSLTGSSAARDGWTCLVTGSGADGAADRWLALEEESSIASDSGLVSISGGECDITVLVSRNTISFLSFIPDGMLTRSERTLLNTVKALIQEIGPEALRIGVGIDSADPLDAFLELELLRSEGRTTLLRLEVLDTGMSLDSLFVIAAGMVGG